MHSNVKLPDRQHWIALSSIAFAQLMVALDATIVTIALPSAQRALRISDAEPQWVATAHTLVLGSLLLLGSRIADDLSRERTFLAGLVGCALASAMGESASTCGDLLAARAPDALAQRLVQGYAVATGWASAILMLAALVSLFMITARKPSQTGFAPGHMRPGVLDGVPPRLRLLPASSSRA